LTESRNAINAGAKQIVQVSRKLLIAASRYGLAIIVARVKPAPNQPCGDVKRWISLDFKAENNIKYSLTASVYFGNKGTVYTLKSEDTKRGGPYPLFQWTYADGGKASSNVRSLARWPAPKVRKTTKPNMPLIGALYVENATYNASCRVATHILDKMADLTKAAINGHDTK
jgi:hypothetical protein